MTRFPTILLMLPFAAVFAAEQPERLAVEAEASPANPGDAILGIWATDKAEAHIEISKTEAGTYTATIIWLEEPFYPPGDEGGMAGEPRIDRENPDPALRDRPIDGLVIMHGLEYDGDREWEDGEIYDPETGNTYSSEIWMTDEGTLKVRGYVGFSLFGRTTEWTPVLGAGEIEKEKFEPGEPGRGRDKEIDVPSEQKGQDRESVESL